jgi:hypothetical protein
MGSGCRGMETTPVPVQLGCFEGGIPPKQPRRVHSDIALQRHASNDERLI